MISLYDILEVSNGQLFGEPGAQIFTDFCIDPAQASPNTLYVTLKNDRGDTHRYIEEAIQKGASGVICMRPPECDTNGVSVVLVRDTVEALMRWSHHTLGKTGAKAIAVTGSYGKTVTAEAIAQVLSLRYRVHHSDDNATENRLGVPLALAKLKPEHEFVVLPFNSTYPGEMAAMIQAAQPQVGVVLTIDHAHTNRFTDIEQVAAEHRLLVEYLSPSNLAVLNYGDDRVRAMGTHTRAKIATIGVESFGANMMAYNVIAGPNGTGFDLRVGVDRLIGRWIPLLGKHQLYSVLTALSVGMHYDIPLEDSLRALTQMSPLAGHMNPLIGINDSILIDDTHGATPQSTLAALDWLASARDPQQRVIFVFGDMENLGSHSQLGHRQIGQSAADIADIFVTEGTEAASAARAALDKGMNPRNIYTTYSTHDIIHTLSERIQLHANDLVLFKGSPVMRMENIVRAMLKNPQDGEKLSNQNTLTTAEQQFQPTRPSWVEIDSEALAGNVRALKAHVGEDVTLVAVLKANAYGHGSVVAAQIALLNGAEYLAVANLQEALDLRDAGITAPILILSYVPAYATRDAIRHNLTLSLYDLNMARAYDRAAREIGGKLRVHVKVDTGMGRLGALAEDAIQLFRHLSTLQNIDVEGIFTHFSSADDDPAYTQEQVNVFKNIIRPLRAAGINFKYIHAANSAATLTSKDYHFNMVRCGVALYGLSPSPHIALTDAFKPVMAWKTRIAQVKKLPAGYMVGYGKTYRTPRAETVATIPVGYADGLRRSPAWGEVLVHGQRAPIIGRISMEKTTINISHLPDVAIGDEVVLLGKQGDAEITADDIAAQLDTINYEVVCNILARVPRR